MSAAASRHLISFESFEFDPASGLLYRGQHEILLPLRAGKVLEVFLCRPGDLLSKDELLGEVWKDAFVGEDSLTQAVSMIRSALGDNPRAPTYIQTIPKRGYRFIAEVRTGSSAEEARLVEAVETIPEVAAMGVGATLGHYEILSEIGAGAMGVVYRARDAVLEREVAIKVLPEDFVSDPGRVARFEREAKLLAAVSHPNIAAIHSLEEAGGTKFPVMELVEGKTLEQKLRSGPMKVEESLDIAKQVASALEAAHERGIIHRDLKPANIKLTPTGQVKVLDFGLAKALNVQVFGGGVSESPTESITIMGSRRGSIVGTAAYMSPEQARGQDVDKQADIWAFGCVLYEMLTGRRPFMGDTVSDTIAGVLEREPDWDALPESTPQAARRVERRCLAKDPARRLHDIADARIELEEELATPAPGDMRRGRSETLTNGGAAHTKWLAHRALPWMVAAVALVAAAVALQWTATQGAGREASSLGIQRWSLPLPEGRGAGLALAISSDGSRIVFKLSGDPKLYLHEQPEGTVTELQESEGAGAPFFSPDGNWIGFIQDDRLKRIAVTGGTPVELCEVTGSRGRDRGATWAADDTIVFTMNAGLASISAFEPGRPEIIVMPDLAAKEVSYGPPRMIPGKRAVISDLRRADIGTADDSQLVVVGLDGGPRHVFDERGLDPSITPNGFLVYLRGDALRAVEIDSDSYATRGPSFPVQGGLHEMNPVRRGKYALADNGMLAYVAGFPWSWDGQPQLAWFSLDDAQNRVEPIIEERMVHSLIDLSPNRQLVAIQVGWINSDILVWDLVRGAPVRRLEWDWDQILVTWMPDNERLLFMNTTGGVQSYYVWNIYQGQPEPFPVDTGEYLEVVPMGASPGADWLIVAALHPETGWDLLLMPLAGEPVLRKLLSTEANEERAGYSPDGQLIAYVSDISGQSEVYVMNASHRGGRGIPIGRAHGFRWGADSDLLYYMPLIDEPGRYSTKLRVASIRREPELQVVGPPRVIDLGDRFSVPTAYHWDIGADGRLISWWDAEPYDHEAGISVVLNWFEELELLAAER